MRNLGLRILINAAALVVTSLIIPGIHLPKAPGAGDWVALIVIALIFALINSFLKPIVKLVSLPVTLVTLGLFGLVINAGLLLFLAWICGLVGLDFSISGFPPDFSLNAIWTAFLAGIVISIVASILSRVFDRDE